MEFNSVIVDNPVELLKALIVKHDLNYQENRCCSLFVCSLELARQTAGTSGCQAKNESKKAPAIILHLVAAIGLLFYHCKIIC